MNTVTTKGRQEGGLWIWNSCFVAYVHLVALVSILFLRPAAKTILLTLGIWFCAGIGTGRASLRIDTMN